MSIREITSHKVNGLNEAITISVLDEPGAGGANHLYAILHDSEPAPCNEPSPATMANPIYVRFQKGPVLESGPNGVSNEALIAVVIDRLRCFQSGPYSCRENALALTKLEEAVHWLHHRTRERMARGVEGTSLK